MKGCKLDAPIACKNNTEVCPPTYDDKGCKQAMTCESDLTNCPQSLFKWDGCPVISTPTCNEKEIICNQGWTEKVICN